MEVVSIFYSAPEDDAIAKFRPHFEQVRDEVGSVLDVHFKTLYWREMAGGLSDAGGQSVIDQRVAGNYEIYFGLMGYQFGVGTEHEYRTAVENHIKTGSPIDAFFGFLNQALPPHSLDLDSFGPVVQFKKDIGSSAKYGKSILYFTFGDEGEFRARARTHLTQAAKVVKAKVRGGRSFGLPPRSPSTP